MDYFSGQKVVATRDARTDTYCDQIHEGSEYTVDGTKPTDGHDNCTSCGQNSGFGINLKEVAGLWCPCELRPIEDFGSSILRKMGAVTEIKTVKPLETVKLWQ